jgi:hypothetical protein
MINLVLGAWLGGVVGGVLLALISKSLGDA